MKASLEINGKKLQSIKTAALSVSYSRDYITRLARDGKIVATHIGRIWYVDVTSLKNYEAVSKQEQEIRKQHLSEERKTELRIKEIKKVHSKKRTARLKNAHNSASFVASFVVAAGIVTGFWLEGFLPSNTISNNQLANVSSSEAQVLDIENPNNTITMVKSSADFVVPEFEHKTTKEKFAETQSGILLLPTSNASGVVPEDYFSDEVKVKKNSLGQTVLIQVDAEGKEFGEEIPFVEIPINNEIQ